MNPAVTASLERQDAKMKVTLTLDISTGNTHMILKPDRSLVHTTINVLGRGSQTKIYPRDIF